jgi:pyruvate kinase
MFPTKLPTAQRPSQTKIVATVGPACATVEQKVELIQSGVDVFRVNTAHGTREEHQATIDSIRSAREQAGVPVGILVDLAGPKIRLGRLPNDQYQCVADETVRFVRGDLSEKPGELTTCYEPLIDELGVGDRVVLADGIVSLIVESTDADSATCRVMQSGLIRTRQGVNLPGVKLSVPTLSEHDIDNAQWAAREGIDFLGESFVRTAGEVLQLKSVVKEAGGHCHVIAKIEKPEALDNLEEIVKATDGVMVARGDLGVEIDIAQIPVVQKRIIEMCQKYHRPVICATQMLDSMQHSRIPTRAEVTDVANAILDGTDACMLSGETAIGKYPRESVKTMHRIAMATEPLFRERPNNIKLELDDEQINPITLATTFAAGRLAEELDARMLIVASGSGLTALRVSKNRNFVPTIGISDSETTLRHMTLYWGVVPLGGVPTEDPAEMAQHVIDQAKSSGYLTEGDRVVMVAGTGLSATRHNLMVVLEVS